MTKINQLRNLEVQIQQQKESIISDLQAEVNVINETLRSLGIRARFVLNSGTAAKPISLAGKTKCSNCGMMGHNKVTCPNSSTVIPSQEQVAS